MFLNDGALFPWGLMVNHCEAGLGHFTQSGNIEIKSDQPCFQAHLSAYQPREHLTISERSTTFWSQSPKRQTSKNVSFKTLNKNSKQLKPWRMGQCKRFKWGTNSLNSELHKPCESVKHQGRVWSSLAGRQPQSCGLCLDVFCVFMLFQTHDAETWTLLGRAICSCGCSSSLWIHLGWIKCLPNGSA